MLLILDTSACAQSCRLKIELYDRKKPDETLLKLMSITAGAEYYRSPT